MPPGLALSDRSDKQVSVPHFSDRHASTRVHHHSRPSSHKTRDEVSSLLHNFLVSSHKGQPKTPSPDPERLQAHRESHQSTNPNKGSSASGQLLEKVRYVYKSPLLSTGCLLYSFRKDDVEPSIAVDMEKRKYCNPEDMVLFLLALCCQDDSSTAAVSRDEIINKRFKDCLREVNQIANSPDLWKQLES